MPTFGLDAIALIVAASYSVHAGWIAPGLVESVRTAIERAHILAFLISILIAGSILSIDYLTLLRTLPLFVAVVLLSSVFAAGTGGLVGALTDRGASASLGLIVAPMMAGGLTAGVLPLALGYGGAFGNPDGMVAVLLPPAILGNLATTITAGTIGHVSGAGQPAGAGATDTEPAPPPIAGDPPRPTRAGLAMAFVLLVMLTGAANVIARVTGLNELVSLIAAAGLMLATDLVPGTVRLALVAVYRFTTKVLVFPALVLVGLLYTPWDVLVAGLSLDTVAVVVATVAMLAGAGYAASRWIGLDPIDGAIFALARCAMGGSGDLAMLSAARRLDLMPLVQIATRVGGALTVLLALVLR